MASIIRGNKVQERGVHGKYDPKTGRQKYGTTGQEGRNFLKALDRFHSGDNWGGATPTTPQFLGSMGGGYGDQTSMTPREDENKNRGYSDSIMNTARDNERDKFLAQTKLNRSDSTLTDDIKMGASDIYEQAKGLFSSKPENTMQEVDPSLLAAAKQQELDMPLGPDNQDGGGAPIDQGLGGYESLTGSPHDGTAPQEESFWEKAKGLFSSDSDDEDEFKPLSKGKQAAVKMATSLLTAKDDPIQSAPVAGVKMGRVAFPNLLASSQRPVNPRYTNKGLG